MSPTKANRRTNGKSETRMKKKEKKTNRLQFYPLNNLTPLFHTGSLRLCLLEHSNIYALYQNWYRWIMKRKQVAARTQRRETWKSIWVNGWIMQNYGPIEMAGRRTRQEGNSSEWCKKCDCIGIELCVYEQRRASNKHKLKIMCDKKCKKQQIKALRRPDFWAHNKVMYALNIEMKLKDTCDDSICLTFHRRRRRHRCWLTWLKQKNHRHCGLYVWPCVRLWRATVERYSIL